MKAATMTQATTQLLKDLSNGNPFPFHANSQVGKAAAKLEAAGIVVSRPHPVDGMLIASYPESASTLETEQPETLSRREADLANDLCQHVFLTLDSEIEFTGEQASRVAFQVERAFKQALQN